MSEPEAAPIYRVLYKDETGYEWSATFESDQEALDQAAMSVNMYGGVLPQAVVDGRGDVVHDQAAIIAAAGQATG